MTAGVSATTPEVDLALERQIFRKLVTRLFPLLIVGIFVAYMDRANLGVVKAPMSEDLGLNATAFGLAAGIFYLGYLLFEVPSNIAMEKFGARIWLARIMISWGLVTTIMMFIGGPMSLNITRFLLGVAEAGFYPGIVLYLTFWFPARLFPRALSTFQVGIPVALAVTTLLSSSLLLLDGVFGIAGWRWVFLAQGVVTLLLGAVFLAFLPNSPKDAKWLTQQEKDYLAAHVPASERGSSHGPGAFRSVLRSAWAWVYALLYFSILLAFWSITYWLPTVIQETFEVGAVKAGFISSIPWVFCALVMVALGISSARTGDRRWHLIACLLIGGVGLLASTMMDSPILVLIALCFAAAGSQSGCPLFYSQTTSVFMGAIAAVAIAFINSLGNISGFVGPYIIGLLVDLTGDTRVGLMCMSGVFVVAALLAYVVTGKSASRPITLSSSSPESRARR